MGASRCCTTQVGIERSHRKIENEKSNVFGAKFKAVASDSVFDIAQRNNEVVFRTLGG